MKFISLQYLLERHSTVGLSLMGVYPATWSKKQVVIVASISALLLGGCAYNLYHNHSAYQGGHRLYLGWTSTKSHAPDSIEQQLLQSWNENSKTDIVRDLAYKFAQAVQQKDTVSADRFGKELCRRFQPIEYFKEDGRWYMHALIGQIYLERGWMDAAQGEFQAVLKNVPPGRPSWGKSPAREIAAYGLTRTYSLQGNYETALKYLAQAPGEENGGCGNANEDERVDNYPKQVVWMIARKPAPLAIEELIAIMGGQFTPTPSQMNGDTSEAQRQHAAVEAALTLGCLYCNEGKLQDARNCWKLVALISSSHPEVRILAKTKLATLPRD